MAGHSFRSLIRGALVLLAVLLVGCSGTSGSTTSTAIPLQILSAKVDVSPATYTGACGAKQDLTFTATLGANTNNLGGAVHYEWVIDHVKSEGDVTFGPGETSKTVTRSLTYAIPADASPQMLASFSTMTPNAVSAPDTTFTIACTVPFQVSDVSVTMQPWTAGCGPQTFGWAAMITAPWNNTGGTVHYTWHFTVGSDRSGSVTFAPGQVTQVVTTSQTYYIVPGGGSGAPPGTPYPTVTGSQILARLYVSSPNTISDYAVPEHVYC